MRWVGDSQSTSGKWLRTLVASCLVVAVVATAAFGSGGVSSGLHLGDTSAAGSSGQPPPDAPGSPALAAAKKQKADKQKEDGKGKGQPGKKKKNKPTGDKDKGSKQGDRHKGDGKGKSKGDKEKGNKKGKGSQNKKGNGNQNKKDKQGSQDKQTPKRDASARAAAPLTLTAVADARVSEAEPTVNFGAAPLRVDGGADPDVFSYLRFDVSGVSEPVQSAKLRLWVPSGGGTGNGPAVVSAPGGWTETGLTWNNRPAPTGSALDNKSAIPEGAWVEYNVTASVKGNGSYSFVLVPESSDGANFHSREEANRPQLVITTASGTPSPTPTPGPSPTPAPGTGLTLPPAADARVSEASPTNNYGTAPQLLVDGGGADPDVAGYLRFDVAGVSGAVQRATLRLWVQANGGTANGPEVRATGASWSENGLTWNNRPAPSGGVLDDKGNLSGGSWVEYNVTSAVTGNGAVGFVLLSQTNDGAIFDAREGTNRPQLVITTGSGTPAPTPSPTPSPTPTPGPGPVATLLAAGDIAGCSSSGDEATAALLASRSGTIVTLGDNAYQDGTSQEFSQCYNPSWGQFKNRTRPATGNHDYHTSGATGYFGYFGTAAGDSTKGYYSYNLGGWHIIALNSNCGEVGGCGAGSPQEKWLRQDLAANPTACTLAYWHHPRFSFGNYSNNAATQALWQALYDAGAEIVLAGHDHNYQRYALQDATGKRDPAGIRQFVVGTGGRSHYALGTPPPNVEAYNGSTYGILQLTLRGQGYDWQFIPEAGKSFTDSGSDVCH